MTDPLIILLKGFWCGCAAMGFGILFNAPTRSLLPIWIGGCVAGLTKFIFLDPIIGAGTIAGSFFGAALASIVSIPLARIKDVPNIIVGIPSIIPLVPGAFAYRAMMGLMKLAKYSDNEYTNVMSQAVYNGVMALFVVMAIAFGLVLPLVAMRAIEQRISTYRK